MTIGFLLLLSLHGATPDARLDSVYTRLAEVCESLPAPEGGDESWACEGPDELVVRIDFSAADAALNAVIDTQGVEQPIDGVLGIDTDKGVIEWRLAGDVPIALIVRSTPMEFADDGSAHRGQAQTLEIRGVNRLMGFSSSIDVRTTPDANALARQQIADAWAREQR